MTTDTDINYHVLLDGCRVGPYDRRTIVGMRLKHDLVNDQLLFDAHNRQITVGELIAKSRREDADGASTFGAAAAGLPPTYGVRFLGRDSFGFTGIGHVRVQDSVLRLEGWRRRWLLGRTGGQVKVPLSCIRDVRVEDTLLTFGLTSKAPFDSSTRRRGVALAMPSAAAARELQNLLPRRFSKG